MLFFAEKALIAEVAGFQVVSKRAKTRIFALEPLLRGKNTLHRKRFVRKISSFADENGRM